MKPPVAGTVSGRNTFSSSDFDSVAESAQAAREILSGNGLGGGHANANGQVGGRQAARNAGQAEPRVCGNARVLHGR